MMFNVETIGHPNANIIITLGQRSRIEERIDFPIGWIIIPLFQHVPIITSGQVLVNFLFVTTGRLNILQLRKHH